MSAARAIASALDARAQMNTDRSRSTSVATVVDALDYGPRWFRAWFQGGYETLVRRSPRLWGALYRGSDRPGILYAVQTALDTLCMRRLQAAIEVEPPDWVVCTHSLPQPRLGLMRRRRPARGPRVAVVVTDLHPHRMWLRGSPDRYFVPHELTRERLERRRPGSAGIASVTGIPVDPACAAAMSGAEAGTGGAAPSSRPGRKDGAPSVLLMSGGIGGGPICEAMEALLAPGADRAPARVTVVCGRNARAHASCLEALTAQRPPEGARAYVHALGYVPHDEFLRLLRASDILIGKPGGATMAEALACGVPMVIYRPMLIPGQEEDNADCLVQAGAGVEATDPNDLRRTVHQLLSTPDRLTQMQASALAAARPRAALDIADALLAS